MPAGIGGIDIATEPDFKSVARHRRAATSTSSPSRTPLLIFEAQAKKLEVKVGDAITISAQTTRGVANTIDCRVVAVARDIGLLSQWNMFISNDSLRTLYQLRPDVTGAIQIHVKAAVRRAARRRSRRVCAAHSSRRATAMMEPDPRAVLDEVPDRDARGLDRPEARRHDLGGRAVVHDVDASGAAMGSVVVLMVILIAIVVTGIMNTLWIAIRERTREIGTLRAIGMQRAGVARLFLLEAGMLGVLGAVAGVAPGRGGGERASTRRNLHVPLSVQLFLMRDTLQSARSNRADLLSAVVLITRRDGLRGALSGAARGAPQTGRRHGPTSVEVCDALVHTRALPATRSRCSQAFRPPCSARCARRRGPLGSTGKAARPRARRSLKAVDDRQKNQGDWRSERVHRAKGEGQGRGRLRRPGLSAQRRPKLHDPVHRSPRPRRARATCASIKNLWFYDPAVGKWERRTERERIGGTNSRRSDFDESRLAEEYDPEDRRRGEARRVQRAGHEPEGQARASIWRSR